MNHRKHDPDLPTIIRLPTMPKPQIPNHQAPLPNNRSCRAPVPPPLLQPPLSDPPTRPLTMLTFLRLLPILMRPEPELCAPVLWTHVDERDVNYHSERRRRVREIGV